MKVRGLEEGQILEIKPSSAESNPKSRTGQPSKQSSCKIGKSADIQQSDVQVGTQANDGSVSIVDEGEESRSVPMCPLAIGGTPKD